MQKPYLLAVGEKVRLLRDMPSEFGLIKKGRIGRVTQGWRDYTHVTVGWWPRDAHVGDFRKFFRRI